MNKGYSGYFCITQRVTLFFVLKLTKYKWMYIGYINNIILNWQACHKYFPMWMTGRHIYGAYSGTDANRAKNYENNKVLLVLYITCTKGNPSAYKKPVGRYAYFSSILPNKFR
jgi:hypothetical protein